MSEKINPLSTQPFSVGRDFTIWDRLPSSRPHLYFLKEQRSLPTQRSGHKGNGLSMRESKEMRERSVRSKEEVGVARCATLGCTWHGIWLQLPGTQASAWTQTGYSTLTLSQLLWVTGESGEVLGCGEEGLRGKDTKETKLP